jgi:hypothetical protein
MQKGPWFKSRSPFIPNERRHPPENAVIEQLAEILKVPRTFCIFTR